MIKVMEKGLVLKEKWRDQKGIKNMIYFVREQNF